MTTTLYSDPVDCADLLVFRHLSDLCCLFSTDLFAANVIQGAGIAIAGLAAGIGMVAFTEVQGERAKKRGGGLSENMSTQISGGLLEDVEVSSIGDLGSLTSQLEQALRASGGTKEEDFTMTEEEKKRIADEADDGW